VADAYWSDSERHRFGRLDLDNTRRRLVSQAFANLGVEAALAVEATNAFISLREHRMGLFPGCGAPWLRCQRAGPDSGGTIDDNDRWPAGPASGSFRLCRIMRWKTHLLLSCL